MPKALIVKGISPLVLSEADLLLGKEFHPYSTYRHWVFCHVTGDPESVVEKLNSRHADFQFVNYYQRPHTEGKTLFRGYVQLLRSRSLRCILRYFPDGCQLYPTKYWIYSENAHRMPSSSKTIGFDNVRSAVRARACCTASTNRRITILRDLIKDEEETLRENAPDVEDPSDGLLGSDNEELISDAEGAEADDEAQFRSYFLRP